MHLGGPNFPDGRAITAGLRDILDHHRWGNNFSPAHLQSGQKHSPASARINNSNQLIQLRPSLIKSRWECYCCCFSSVTFHHQVRSQFKSLNSLNFTVDSTLLFLVKFHICLDLIRLFKLIHTDFIIFLNVVMMSVCSYWMEASILHLKIVFFAPSWQTYTQHIYIST